MGLSSGTTAHRNHNDDGASNPSLFISARGNSTFLYDRSDLEQERDKLYIKRRNRKPASSWWEYMIMVLTQRRGTQQDEGGEPLLVSEKDISTRSSKGVSNGLISPSPSLKRKNSPTERKMEWHTYLIFTSISGLGILAILLTVNIILILTTIFLYHSKPWSPLDITANPFTRGIAPIACHSHNDYWHNIPLFSALHAGCISTEADVWLLPSPSTTLDNQQLYVGHNRASLTPGRTFQSLYIQPLVKLLELANPALGHPNDTLSLDGEERNGVFDTDPSKTLVLLIDVKTHGHNTWPTVLKELEPLRERGWLTFVRDGVVHERAITVIGTGETPFDLLTSNTSYRDTFFDAPLDRLWTPLPLSDTSDDIHEPSLPTPILPEIDEGQGMVGISSTSNFTSQNSYYASVSYAKAVGRPWRGKVTEEQLKIVRGHIRGARERGLKVRYWGVPAWPRWMRNEIWGVLLREGVDVLGVDDLSVLNVL